MTSRPPYAPTPWFPVPPLPAAAGTEPATVLFCLPHAGAGASAYRHWPALLGTAAEVVPVQLPGRENRFGEPPATRTSELVDELVDRMLERAAHHPRLALFGHSMGALLGHELAHALTARGRTPDHLFASAYRAPSLPRATEDVHRLPREELIAHLGRMEGTPPQVFAHPELVDLLLPVIRADYALCETYRFTARPPLRTPVTVFGGSEDPGVGPEHLAAWAELTTGPFRSHVLPGGHFYLHDRLDDVLSAVAAALGAPAAVPRGST
ncbi:thioesterase II family protein [Streptomyces sp. NPDC059957]|uniref:thioesterase II family protein n=1 Tax=unclassified Streptomyces TaxID=2593676 RepID=UPI00364BF735